jgi:2-oxoglutarate dehydrogenase E2 component (dihydrolipoamide succinyltransferase)
MADVIMPQMGESIAEGTVTKWLKNVGDRVERDEPLFEISTDKVDAEIPSPAAGVLKEIRVEPGTTVPVNTVVGVVAAEAGAAETASAVPPATPPAAAPAPQAGAPAAVPQPSAPPAAPQATPPVAARQATPPTPPAAPAPWPESPAPAAAPREAAPAAPPPRQPAPARPAPPPPVEYEIEGESPAPPPLPREPAPTAETPRSEMSAEELRLTRSSPVVRRIAAEHQVDIRAIPGTGIGGRVTKHDILGHIERGAGPEPAAPPAQTPRTAAPPATPVAPGQATPASPDARPPAQPQPPSPPPPLAAAAARVEVVPMSPIRKRTAEHMVLSRRTSAHVSTVFEVDMTRVDQLRQKHVPAFEQRGVRLTYTPFILKAVVDGLKVFPVLNASIDGDNIVYHKEVNLGVAVALDWGLIVPVVHHADEKNVLGLARAAHDLADRARAKKLKVEEVQGGTFTVTNPGVFGSLFGTPIINQPQVAILDVGTIEKRPVVRDDAIAIRTMCYLALTFDHRLVDGSDADRFMAHVKKKLQEFDEAAL